MNGAPIDLGIRGERQRIEQNEAARHTAFWKVTGGKPAEPFLIDEITIAGRVRHEHGLALRVLAHDDG